MKSIYRFVIWLLSVTLALVSGWITVLLAGIYCKWFKDDEREESKTTHD